MTSHRTPDVALAGRWFALGSIVTLCLVAPGCGGSNGDRKTQETHARDQSASQQPNETSPQQNVNRKTAGAIIPEIPRKTAPEDTGEREHVPDDPKTPVLQPRTLFRPSDRRPKHDDVALAKRGIYRYASKRLVLYTDLDPKVARTLPPILDAAYRAWEAYFGKLPANRERTPFQVTGYLMVDKARFEAARLIPGDLPKFVNGRHRGYRFWMYDPQWAYYRRHLMIHEATHCFMYCIRDGRFPEWYMEGMAEYFGMHRRDETGKYHFGVMPHAYKDFVGLGRIEYVQRDARQGRPFSIQDVAKKLTAPAFVHNRAYAWSWALCRFFDSHPRYRKRFRALGRIHSSRGFEQEFAQLISDESPHVFSEWILFAGGLCYGYDAASAAMDVKPGDALAIGHAPRTFTLRADRGWQSSGVWVDQGQSVEITASGQFELAQKPKPWVCEPQGVSITYFQGRPLGELTAVIVPDSKKSLPITVPTLRSVPVGRKAVVVAPIKDTLYLRVNDSFAKLSDNTGGLKVTLRRVK
ncbi:MAG: hypothetical protein ACE5KM_08915 [Planctomycetaceae bacterium]